MKLISVKLTALAMITFFSQHSLAASSSSVSAKEPWQLAEETEVWTPIPSVVTANENSAPSDAIILFDGKSLSQWQGAEGGEAKWEIQKGVLTVVPKIGDIKTKESFCDVQLHVEWTTPTKVTGDDGKELTSQARNNSGIFLQEQYEVQILDSFNNKTYSNGQAGSIYKQHIPLVNPTRAPGVWQTYDIIFTAPTFNDAKKLLTPARVTVLLNGVLVQNNVEIQGATAWIGKPVYTAHGCAPLRLQDHGNKVSFRNIWLRKL
jgi:hypothetical protein